MNLPNLLTLSRIPLTFLIVLLVYCEWTGAATCAFLAFIWCGITDWLDGHLARKHGIVSSFGIFMDALTDKIFVLGVMVALTDARLILGGSHFVPVLMFLLVLTREFVITGMRLVAALQGVVVAAEKGGKLKTIMQIVALGAFLFVPMVQRDVQRLSPWDLSLVASLAHYLAFGMYAVAVLLTVWSGLTYLLKYRHVFAEKKP
ncbi:MAG TPA: CDP-diacylglycerol--glycerol-3-phosphate 3-phosphatidyltransferase [Opitutaceae bacterium]|nr:CDP-diacylglycerol--glycerol-3-phosphate 3-phosphatidyltransferase [Opitutaceae bacterium]